jgi:hypothetical protein
VISITRGRGNDVKVCEADGSRDHWRALLEFTDAMSIAKRRHVKEASSNTEAGSSSLPDTGPAA